MPGCQTREENANDLMREENEREQLIRDDAQLSPDQIDHRYNPVGYGEHPVITRDMWIDEVSAGNTLTGYWEWVLHRLNECVDDNIFTV